jgi:GNAT superfamily N-acetyltransferase
MTPRPSPRSRSQRGAPPTPDSCPPRSSTVSTSVALDEGEVVRGFTHTGPTRDDDLDPAGRGEVYTIYVDPATWRHGIGSALLRAVDEFWRPSDVHELVLWAFKDNADGRAFYERLGWRTDGAEQVDDFGSAHPVEVRYRRALPKG